MKINLPTIFSQYDSRWAQILLGNNTAASFNIYNYGCLITCLAMACKYYGKEETPATINEKLRGAKGFVSGGLYVWGSISKIYTDIIESRVQTPSALTDAQIGEIKTAIDAGFPVMIHLDYNPRTVENDMHYVLVVDNDPTDENNFTITDPLGGKVHSLKDYLGWFRPSVRKTIEQYIIIKGKKPKVDASMISISKESYDLYTRNHDQWHKLVHYLKPDADPNGTLFEDVQTVIAGIKSRQTDLENQLKQAIEKGKITEQEVANQKDKLANMEAECQRELKQAKDEYVALKATVPDTEKLRGSYEGRISELEGQLREAQKQIGLRDLEISRLTGEAEVVSWITKLLQWIKDRLK